jgi:hypothetical protein
MTAWLPEQDIPGRINPRLQPGIGSHGAERSPSLHISLTKARPGKPTVSLSPYLSEIPQPTDESRIIDVE